MRPKPTSAGKGAIAGCLAPPFLSRRRQGFLARRYQLQLHPVDLLGSRLGLVCAAGQCGPAGSSIAPICPEQVTAGPHPRPPWRLTAPGQVPAFPSPAQLKKGLAKAICASHHHGTGRQVAGGSTGKPWAIVMGRRCAAFCLHPAAAEGIPCPSPVLQGHPCSGTHTAGENTGHACGNGKQGPRAMFGPGGSWCFASGDNTQEMVVCNPTEELEGNEGQAGIVQLLGLCFMLGAPESFPCQGSPSRRGGDAGNTTVAPAPPPAGCKASSCLVSVSLPALGC